ncbi:MAG: alginate lyase family protein [Verrucomicrobiota bacterium]
MKVVFSKNGQVSLLCIFMVTGVSMGVSAGKTFNHPGCLESRAELDFVKDRIKKQKQPWKDAFESLRASRLATLHYSPTPFGNVHRGDRGTGSSGASEMMRDAQAAYAHALVFVLADEKAHAEKSIEILNAWSGKLESITGADAKLLGAKAFFKFVNAAELIRYSDAGWEKGDRERFENLLRDVFFPLLKEYREYGSGGNWDAIIASAHVAMGVFLNDKKIFNHGIRHYKSGDGHGSLEGYVNRDGTTQETSRDQAHEQMGIGGLADAAEIAWHQGIDLYSRRSHRLLVGAEGVASRVLKNRRGTKKKDGEALDIWERIYNHYHNREGEKMPRTERLLKGLGYRPEEYGFWSIGFGTLTHCGVGDGKKK